MSWIMILLLVAAGFLILMPVLTYLSARRQVGREIDSTNTNAGQGDRLVYFYSPKCAPCRSMTPLIDQLSQQHPEEVFKVDVQQDLEAARSFNIRATPTTVLVKNNRVLDIALGAKSRTQLERMLKRVC
jgi:thioredoxin 1